MPKVPWENILWLRVDIHENLLTSYVKYNLAVTPQTPSFVLPDLWFVLQKKLYSWPK